MSGREVSGSVFLGDPGGTVRVGSVRVGFFFLGEDCPGGNCPGGTVLGGIYRSLFFVIYVLLEGNVGEMCSALFV